MIDDIQNATVQIMNSGIRPPTDVQDAVKTMCDEKGLTDTMKALGMSREAVMRLSGGHPVRPGTIALAQQKLKELNQ